MRVRIGIHLDVRLAIDEYNVLRFQRAYQAIINAPGRTKGPMERSSSLDCWVMTTTIGANKIPKSLAHKDYGDQHDGKAAWESLPGTERDRTISKQHEEKKKVVNKKRLPK